MDTQLTAPEPTPDAKKVESIHRPDRNRPDSNQREAAKFLAIAARYMHNNKLYITPETCQEFLFLFRRYAKNTGLRGKQKESIRRIVEAAVRDLKQKLPR